MNVAGFVLPAAVIGLGSIYLKPRRGIRGFYPLPSSVGPQEDLLPQVTLEEVHHDELEITDHPVERGAVISDHAFKRPAEVVIRCAWSNSPSKPGGLIGAAVGVGAALGGSVSRIAAAAGPTAVAAGSLLTGNAPSQAADIYDKLLGLQASATPFDVYTGKRIYRDMLFRSLTVTTDLKTENVLMLTATCRQVLIVSTTTIQTSINKAGQAAATEAHTAPTLSTGQKSLVSGTTHYSTMR